MIRQWYGRVKFLEPVVSVWETTAGKARANILRRACEAGYNVRLPDVQVRLGPTPWPDNSWPERQRRAQTVTTEPT